MCKEELQGREQLACRADEDKASEAHLDCRWMKSKRTLRRTSTPWQDAGRKRPAEAQQSIQRKISEAQTKKYSLHQQLQRMRDSKNFIDMKNNAVGSKSSQSGSDLSSKSGYKLHHLMVVGVIGMLAGAYAQLYVLPRS